VLLEKLGFGIGDECSWNFLETVRILIFDEMRENWFCVCMSWHVVNGKVTVAVAEMALYRLPYVLETNDMLTPVLGL
jgi:hypothetical protein